MNTPDIEWEKLKRHLAENYVEKGWTAVTAEIITQLLASRDAYWKERVKEARSGVIKTVEDTIAEFGDQGMECVAGILQESFHGQKNVEY